ncbi:helix-turn-helix domain-containing protein [Paenibacillus alvei]|uniref:helix-turn-helix domain-containing protein n=1 Tax=Paenibacillus alvei TaxID=44250 RepID=UPI0013DAEDF9|nr:helix-turn-helix transcriptional regulator [Paenibacillus alvei]NEZ45457.1 helix-turn-helix domain-containing protein [Paenibacillus alvei]
MVQDSILKEEYRLMRIKKRIKLREIAEYVGCELSHVSNWERGKVNFSKKRLQKYIEFVTGWSV